MKNIDKLIINSPYEEPPQCGKLGVKRNGYNTCLLIMMEGMRERTAGMVKGKGVGSTAGNPFSFIIL